MPEIAEADGERDRADGYAAQPSRPARRKARIPRVLQNVTQRTWLFGRKHLHCMPGVCEEGNAVSTFRGRSLLRVSFRLVGYKLTGPQAKVRQCHPKASCTDPKYDRHDWRRQLGSGSTGLRRTICLPTSRNFRRRFHVRGLLNSRGGLLFLKPKSTRKYGARRAYTGGEKSWLPIPTMDLAVHPLRLGTTLISAKTLLRAALTFCLVLLNSDGTFTRIIGSGFTYDGSGDPTAGTISSIERSDDATGTTIYEFIIGLRIRW